MSMLKEYYLQPDAPDPVLPEAEVLRCLRRFVPTAKAVTYLDESGGEARTYIVDETILLKVQRPQQVRVGTSLAREVFYLNQLAAVAPDLPVPRVLGYDRETNLLEYNIQTRMPGVAYVEDSLVAAAARARSAVPRATPRYIAELLYIGSRRRQVGLFLRASANPGLASGRCHPPNPLGTIPGCPRVPPHGFRARC